MTANQLAIVVYGAFSLLALFVLALVAGSTWGAVTAIAAMFGVYVFQALQEEPDFQSEFVLHLLWAAIVLAGIASLVLSIIAGV